jgi:hypothetical protein
MVRACTTVVVDSPRREKTEEVERPCERPWHLIWPLQGRFAARPDVFGAVIWAATVQQVRFVLRANADRLLGELTLKKQAIKIYLVKIYRASALASVLSLQKLARLRCISDRADASAS